jgi:lysozyme
MKISSRGLEIIQHFEGWSASVYRCSAGYITQGWGSCYDDRGLPIAPDADDIDKVTGESYLRYACRHVEEAITRLVLTRAQLTQGMFDASCSLAYNIGTGAFARSTIRQRLARGDYEGAADIWWQFRRGGGRILPGLVRRRAAEKELFLGDYQ